MKGWGFVILAYGIVWSAILLYLLSLKRRLNKLNQELSRQEFMDGENNG